MRNKTHSGMKHKYNTRKHYNYNGGKQPEGTVSGDYVYKGEGWTRQTSPYNNRVIHDIIPPNNRYSTRSTRRSNSVNRFTPKSKSYKSMTQKKGNSLNGLTRKVRIDSHGIPVFKKKNTSPYVDFGNKLIYSSNLDDFSESNPIIDKKYADIEGSVKMSNIFKDNSNFTGENPMSKTRKRTPYISNINKYSPPIYSKDSPDISTDRDIDATWKDNNGEGGWKKFVSFNDWMSGKKGGKHRLKTKKTLKRRKH